jgi:hypothetical protein
MANYKDIKYQFPTSATTSGTFADARISEGSVTQHVAPFDDDKVQSNLALLGFKTAANGSLAKYNLVDQIIDEFEDSSGIDGANSTNESLSSGTYFGGVAPIVTSDHDDTGTDGDYTWYKWTGTGAGSYSISGTANHEYLLVGGGGAGGTSHGGGAGGGGVLTATGLSLTGGNTYTVTVGAGGAGSSTNAFGNVGNDTILSGTGITTLTAGGGGGGGPANNAGGTGRAQNGSGGGGGGYNSGAGAGHGAGFSGGGPQSNGAPHYGGGGGGGAGGSGVAGTSGMSGTDGDGGPGVANDIIQTGTDVYYAGGGGGCAFQSNAASGQGGIGGGGNGTNYPNNAQSGTANTGGGGGATSHGGTSGSGGSGIVILRRLTSDGMSGGNDLTLQSTANTASSAATKADMVMLMENAAGTASINVDIKGYVTANGGTNWTEGTLVDEGTWGTNKKIYAFHDATVTSGTDMRYKITTHNQNAGSKETKIHAVSIGWKAS